MTLHIVDSVSALTPLMRGQIVITGSHGGVSAAHLALLQPPALIVFNDAGVGLDNAGIESLSILQQHGVAAATVSYLSARIGDAQSTQSTGRISHANALAQARGVRVGQRCVEAINFFTKPLLHMGITGF